MPTSQDLKSVSDKEIAPMGIMLTDAIPEMQGPYVIRSRGRTSLCLSVTYNTPPADSEGARCRLEEYAPNRLSQLWYANYIGTSTVNGQNVNKFRYISAYQPVVGRKYVLDVWGGTVHPPGPSEVGQANENGSPAQIWAPFALPGNWVRIHSLVANDLNWRLDVNSGLFDVNRLIDVAQLNESDAQVWGFFRP